MRLFIFGLGYTAARIAARLRADGRAVEATGRSGTVAFDNEAAVTSALRGATHILSSVPPGEDGADPVLARYAPLLEGGQRLLYLSSTGVYGNCGGAWVDESAAIGSGRRGARAAADFGWQGLGATVLRLPGIYGPGRSALERVASGRARRVSDQPGHLFSRVHVDDIVSAAVAALDAPPAVFNLADDCPATQDDVLCHAAALLGLPPPPMVPLSDLPPMAQGFYAEDRRIASARARRLLGWRPRYPDYRAGLRACMATIRPSIANAPPAAASAVQR